MGLNIGNLLKDGLGALAGQIPVLGPAIKKLIQGVDDHLEGLTPEQRLALEKTVIDAKTQELKALLSDNADFRKMATAEINSDDWFVRRARPANLWLWIITFAAWLVLFPLLRAFGVDAQLPDLNGIPTHAWYTYVSLFLGYGTMREIGKNNKLKAGLSPE